ncbi:DUF5689 domain-containing protein [Niabella ginsengisoli]|uniref:DUF5689 domain-containing protein n=1 Tax=Niabella ginsengisoli TaxID=522298 RepID=A0ABS9SMV3_9BACT|nr:DUF5689 domain-containing protein [Niabella ginsengisoli]MCH5599682.1 DUF5689 domain-containing protein [Niabella ginsengisoli]
MKNNILNSLLIALLLLALGSCKKDGFGNYPGGVPYDYIAIFDVRNIYKGQDVQLTKETLAGATSLYAVVTSDHDGGNLPEGLLVVQDNRRNNWLRGICVNIGADAAKYHPGDSVKIKIEGATITRKDGILQITGVAAANDVVKTSSGNDVTVTKIDAGIITANPDIYESIFVMITKAGFTPVPQTGTVMKDGEYVNDGFATIRLVTDPDADFANDPIPGLAVYKGITFNAVDAVGKLTAQIRPRIKSDLISMGNISLAQPLIITGLQRDPQGGDGNYEYVQLMATGDDIDFSVTPYCIVFTNNAGAATPLGAPANGWATGGQRTIKWNITSGVAKKGQFFYFGGTAKMINGSGSTPYTGDNWYGKQFITTKGYFNTGDGGLVIPSAFGSATSTPSGPFANSGNPCGVAIFKSTSITKESIPADVVFVNTKGTGGSLYQAATDKTAALGYRITTNDWYDAVNPDNLEAQPFIRMTTGVLGINTKCVPYYTADLGYFDMLGGVYNVTLGRWTKARSETKYIDLEKTSTWSEIETGEDVTRLEE